MNEAVIVYVSNEDLDGNALPVTKAVRVEFEGTLEMLLTVLNDANGTMHEGWAEAFNVVAMEGMHGQELNLG